MATELLPGFPTWAQEVAGTVTVHSQFVLYGNIRDRFLVPPPGSHLPKPILDVLWAALQPFGYECLIVSDQVDGIRVFPEDPERHKLAASVVGRVRGRPMLGNKASLENLRTVMARVAGVHEPPPVDPGANQQEAPPATDATGGEGPGASPAPPQQLAARPRIAVVLDFASRLQRGRELDPEEQAFFLFSQKLALTAPAGPGRLPGGPALAFSPVIWLADGERDLPAWFAAGIERIRLVSVPLPGMDERLAAAPLFAQLLTPSATEKELAGYAQATDRMTLHAMQEVARIAKDRGMSLGGIRDAARIYRLGVEQNPWRRASVHAAISKGEKSVPRDVLGQPQAVLKTLDILKRASLGLSGAQATSTGTRPKGLLFFAGPTGVGKTELAKNTAKLVFGDENSYLRLDMSEYDAPHAADRLTGAPPGYVGYEAGGQLTGPVRRNPFQVILFDEIEKAHPQVMDKFLQILEDGRLTDGQGTTTFFSECVIIFTSNLGIIETDRQTGVRTHRVTRVDRFPRDSAPKLGYTELADTITHAIKEHITLKIGRPELMNRLGDNIVVFDFISDEAGQDILANQVENVLARVRGTLQVAVTLAPTVGDFLWQECTRQIKGDSDMTQLDYGGRGIGNTVESRLVNPLARYLFDKDCGPGARVTVKNIHMVNGVATVEAEPSR